MLEPSGLAVGSGSEQSDTQKLINFATKFKAALVFSVSFCPGGNPHLKKKKEKSSDPASSGAQVQSEEC